MARYGPVGLSKRIRTAGYTTSEIHAIRSGKTANPMTARQSEQIDIRKFENTCALFAIEQVGKYERPYLLSPKEFEYGYPRLPEDKTLVVKSN